MRISSAALALPGLVAGCSGSPAQTIACGPTLAERCTVEEAATAAGKVLTLRDPYGGFRRLLITSDGRDVVAADGAEPARVEVIGNAAIDLRIGGDRYRLPATIGAER